MYFSFENGFVSSKERSIPPQTVKMERTENTFTSFLERKFDEARDANNKQLLVDVAKKNKKLLVKIENFRKEKLTEQERTTETCESILRQIPESSLLRALFRKDMTRQTIHEKSQVEWIHKNLYSDAQKMNADRNGICISKGKLHRITKETPRPDDATKTFDVEVPSKKIFAVLKHTSVPGGAQDNQFRDVKCFVEEIRKYLTETPNAEETFVFYLDGKYYTSKKNDELRAMIPKGMEAKIVITCCESIVGKLEQ